MITVRCFVCNMLQENCFVVSDETKECVIIDCGAYYEEERTAITEYIRREGLTPTHLLCTHGHLDHHFGDNTLFEAYGLYPEVHTADKGLMERMKEQAEEMFGMSIPYDFPQPQHFFDDEETIPLGNHQIKVMPTPGHSMGSVTFHCVDEHIAFTGDTLFRMSIGRTDLEGGSMMQIIQSLRMLAQLPDDTVIYTGHGPKTTIGDELRYNPYMDR